MLSKINNNNNKKKNKNKNKNKLPTENATTFANNDCNPSSEDSVNIGRDTEKF
jgi:hypothetical protein